MTMFIANGAPKTGTHYLCETLSRLGMSESLSPWYYKMYSDPKREKPLHQKDEQPLRPDGWYFCHKHLPHERKREAKGLPVITIFRHPRDTLISRTRYFKERDPIAHLRGDPEGITFANQYRQWVGWITDGGASFCVLFEQFALHDHEALLNLCQYVDIEPPRDPEAFFYQVENCNTIWNPTRTGSHSRWQSHWNSQLDAAWELYGGKQLEEELGYHVTD